jgi:hypothetical protein
MHPTYPTNVICKETVGNIIPTVAGHAAIREPHQEWRAAKYGTAARD